jgi:hypothetical protein
MSAQPPLFPASELVSDATRQGWRARVAFLWEHGKYLNEWEAGFMQSIKAQLERGEDLSLAQSAKLGKIFHRENERLG